jgi:hypothetical protein
VRELLASKDVNTEAEECAALGAVTKLCFVTTQQTEEVSCVL